MHCSLPGSSVHGISLIRILEWVAISFPRGSSWPRDQTCVSCIAGISLHCRPIIYQLSHQGKPYVNNYLCPANSSVAFWSILELLFIYLSLCGVARPPPPAPSPGPPRLLPTQEVPRRQRWQPRKRRRRRLPETAQRRSSQAPASSIYLSFKEYFQSAFHKIEGYRELTVLPNFKTYHKAIEI